MREPLERSRTEPGDRGASGVGPAYIPGMFRAFPSFRLRLACTKPYAWPELLEFMAARAIPGVEAVADGRYLRTIAFDGAVGWVAVALGEDGSHLTAEAHVTGRGGMPGMKAAVPGIAAAAGATAPAIEVIEARLRRVFDLDADITAIRRHLARDARLRPLVAVRPGLRVPGTWDPFELAIRAILGQQVSVAAARTLAGRFAAMHGRQLDPAPPVGVPGAIFPAAAEVRADDFLSLGVTRPRAAALAGLARAVAADPGLLALGGDLDTALARLTLLPGVGPWTANYIAMRALRHPDAFPASDLGLLKALAVDGRQPTRTELARHAEAWRPYRAYAAMHLWCALPPPRGKS